jgi:hypothetical protein
MAFLAARDDEPEELGFAKLRAEQFGRHASRLNPAGVAMSIPVSQSFHGISVLYG